MSAIFSLLTFVTRLVISFVPLLGMLITVVNMERVTINNNILANKEISRREELVVVSSVLVFALFKEFTTSKT